MLYLGDWGVIFVYVICLSYFKICFMGLKKMNKRIIIIMIRNYENIRVIYKVIDILIVLFSCGWFFLGFFEVVRVFSLLMKSRGLG